MERNFQLGDQIEIGGYRGVVTEIAMRVTYLRTEDGTRVVVPNSLLFTNTVSISAAAEGPGSAGEGA
jgi:small-conductance mechanosensitive channel